MRFDFLHIGHRLLALFFAATMIVFSMQPAYALPHAYENGLPCIDSVSGNGNASGVVRRSEPTVSAAVIHARKLDRGDTEKPINANLPGVCCSTLCGVLISIPGGQLLLNASGQSVVWFAPLTFLRSAEADRLKRPPRYTAFSAARA